MRNRGFDLGSVAGDLGRRGLNTLTTLRNALIDVLPGDKPEWLIVDLSGSYPARRQKRSMISRVLSSGERPQSLEEFEAMVSTLLRAEWLAGVVFRSERLNVDLATAYALRKQLNRLRAGGKKVVVVAENFDNVGYYLASVADRVIAPESAEFFVNGLSLSTTFMADALARFGVRFEKLAIREYKNAGDQLALAAMSDAQREQYGALLDSFTQTITGAVAQSRDTTPDSVSAWIDEGVTSANQAKRLGMIDEVAYEDEHLTKRHRPYASGARFIPGRIRPSGDKRVAVVTLSGNIVPGRSRKLPLQLPLFGDELAGSETLVRALRNAGADTSTAAVVFHVDSGGGSALASDLIWREVKLLADRMPVVASMGQLAASGGYYVLTHATEIIATPTTLTGSIGVVMLKPVLEEFNARYGFTPESVTRGRFAEIMSSARGFDEDELALLRRYNQEVYDRFVARVAEGRKLSAEWVNELGRGRVWSGVDALEHGLVDQLGDVALAVERARELAGLSADAPTWNVEPPKSYQAPVIEAPGDVLSLVGTLLQERALLLPEVELKLR
ncbi:MAG TPA: signal peptide peptidase SppA [Trueperaceae bacterium]|nr:signal peptide peptidase SppA [Trueperaceae bacterium]